MSWKATAWVKELTACADGAELSKGQKLILMVLADYHNTAKHEAWPSLVELAEQSLCSLATVKRDLAYLEQHRVLQRKRSSGGSGKRTAYAFGGLDFDNDKQAHSEPVYSGETGSSSEPFFCPKKTGSEQAHGERKTGSEQAHGGHRNKESTGSTKRQPVQPAAASSRELPSRADAMRWAERNGYAYRDFCRRMTEAYGASVGKPDDREGDIALVKRIASETGIPEHIALALEGLVTAQ